MAFGPLEMTHAEFWSITPAEFAERLKGYHWREEREWERTAWLAAVIVNPWIKRKVTPKQLLRGTSGHDPIARAEAMKKVAEKLDKRKMN